MYHFSENEHHVYPLYRSHIKNEAVALNWTYFILMGKPLMFTLVLCNQISSNLHPIRSTYFISQLHPSTLPTSCLVLFYAYYSTTFRKLLILWKLFYFRVHCSSKNKRLLMGGKWQYWLLLNFCIYWFINFFN